MKNNAVSFIDYSASTDTAQKKLHLLCGIAPAAIHSVPPARHVADVLRLLAQFPDCVGYSKNRRGGEILDLSDEARVQDLTYFMLRPSIHDLVPEYPVGSTLRQYSLQDFRSAALKTVIEVKIVRDKRHGKSLRTELNDDAMNYKTDPLCDDLIFFIYDPQSYIESPAGLIAAIEGPLSHKGKAINLHCVVQR